MAEHSDIGLLVTRQQVARLLAVSVRTVDALLATKELPSRRIGRRRLVPRQALLEFVKKDHETRGADETQTESGGS